MLVTDSFLVWPIKLLSIVLKLPPAGSTRVTTTGAECCRRRMFSHQVRGCGRRLKPFRMVKVIITIRIVGIRAMAQMIPGCRDWSDIAHPPVVLSHRIDIKFG